MPRKPRAADLPDFEAPPVTEVVLSVQFDTLAALGNVHAGLLWTEYRAEYPRVSEKPPLNPNFETFGGGGAPLPTQIPFRFEALFDPTISRFWFEEAGGTHLMQVQNDRIVHNWRRRDTENEYPRYEPIADRFEREIEKFEDFLRREGLGELRVNQCEVTYINTIQLPDGADPHRHLNRITPLWSGRLDLPNLLEPENVLTQARYILKEDGQPFGRAYVNFTPIIRNVDLSPAVQLDITVRGRPAGQSAEAAFDLLDREREIVVRTFAAVTTPEMHREWERKGG